MKRLTFSSSFLGIVFSARLAFSKRSWPYVLALALPWLLCAGQRCMTRMANRGKIRRSLSSYYRFLSDGKWRMTVLFRSLFDLVVQTWGDELSYYPWKQILPVFVPWPNIVRLFMFKVLPKI
jgi:hypothetical protein